MLTIDLQHNRPTSYFNDTDYFVFDNGMCDLLVTKLEFVNGIWWTLSSLRFKVSCLASINSKELIGKEVKLKGLEYYGVIASFLSPRKASPLIDLAGSGHSKPIISGRVRSQIGVHWFGGPQVKKNGLASYWVDTCELELKF